MCLLQHIRLLLQFLQWHNRDVTLEWLGRVPNTVRKLQGEALLEIVDVSALAVSPVVHRTLTRNLEYNIKSADTSVGDMASASAPPPPKKEVPSPFVSLFAGYGGRDCH